VRTVRKLMREVERLRLENLILAARLGERTRQRDMAEGQVREMEKTLERSNARA